MVALGSRECKELFLLDEGHVFLNHGSFGTVPKSVFTAYTDLLKDAESVPDKWFRQKYQPLMKKSCEALAPIVNCNPEDLVFVENASVGVYAALKSVGIKPGQGVLNTKLSYPAIVNTSRQLSEDIAGEHHVLDIEPPISSKEEVVEKYRSYLSAHPDIKVAVIDHITSPSTIVLPVKEIVQVCREKGVVTIIDGAHAIGHLQVDLKDLNPDYYTGNLHKWFYCPRGCGILYIRPELQATAQPPVPNDDHYKGYPHNFFYQGTRDYTPYCLIPEAIRFQQSLGGRDAIVSYSKELCWWGAKLLSEKWAEPLLPIPPDMRVPSMALIRVPSVLQGKNNQAIVDSLGYKYRVIVSIHTTAGELWLRVSCNAYNTRSDFEHLSEAVLDLMKNSDEMN